jgi:hypothetical protein
MIIKYKFIAKESLILYSILFMELGSLLLQTFLYMMLNKTSHGG